jgi:hypothetical protein
MIRCRTCVMPNTRPDTAWIEGECSACISYKRRPTIDWDARKAELVKLLDRHDGRCIVPSSGGKDSTYQALTLLEMGADVTVVTARTCHLTALGRANIDNLARYARTIEVVPNMTVRAKLNRLGLEMVGDISWPEHAAIFSTPFRMSKALGIPLLFYGENPQDQYGGPMGSDEAKQMTRRWVSEFGGFLGLRPDDFVGMEGLTERDMKDYMPPGEWAVVTAGIGRKPGGVEAHFLGQYLPWDSRENARFAVGGGLAVCLPSAANWWAHENLDNAQTGLHDYFMFRKFGFGRGCQQISCDVRFGRISRDFALHWVETHDSIFPEVYAGVPVDEVLDRIGMTRARLDELIERFSNRDL